MIKDNPGSDRCRFCHSHFSVEILGKIEDDKEDVYCEICGDIIKRVNDRYNFNPPNIPENESKTKTNIMDRPGKLRKKLEPNPDALHYPIGRVFYDSDFPLTFKSNFIIVFSRLICYSALRLDRAGEIDLRDSDPSENVINDLYMATRVIQNKRIKSEFLNNLREMSTEEFEDNLRKIQAKIHSNRQYLEDFHVYSRWFIKRVFCIITEYKPNDQLTKFEKTILNDLQLLTIDDLKLPAKFEKIKYENVELEETREDSEFDMTLGPQKTSITYEDYLALIEIREDISVGMNRVGFYKTLIKCGNATSSEIDLRWKCAKKKHAWQASYNSIRNGDGCPRCPKSSEVITMEDDNNINEEGGPIKFFNYLSKNHSISSVKRGLQQWQSNKVISLSLVENLAKSVKNAYIKDLKNRHKQVTLTFGNPFVTLTNQKLVNRYLNRAKYNYIGIIYKIKDTITGRFYYGLTTQSLAKRWNKHVRNYKASNLNPDSLDYFIFKLEEDLINQGYTNSKAYSIINSRFERIPIEVCFDLLTLLQREKFYISNARKTNPSMCFNIAPGGGGFRLVDYISLNDLIVGLAKGYTLNAIAADLGVSLGAVSKFCQKFWGGYYDSLDLFLKPVVEELIKMGYDRKYIAAALGGEDNRDKPYKSGHYRFTTQTLTRYSCERWWPDCKDWGDVQEKFLKEIFESLVLKGYSYKDMVEELVAFNDKQQLKYRFRKLFKDEKGSGLGAARRILLKPLLKSLLPNDTDADIIEKLNLKNWLPFGASNNKITNENRLLNYFVESIWLYDYMVQKKGRGYETRIRSLYNGYQPTDIVRHFLKTGVLKFQS